MSATESFLQARDFLIDRREDYAAAYAGFRWPRLAEFNWALDYFDVVARGNPRTALWVVNEDGSEAKPSFAEMSARSNRVANFLRAAGVKRGDLVRLGRARGQNNEGDVRPSAQITDEICPVSVRTPEVP